MNTNDWIAHATPSGLLAFAIGYGLVQASKIVLPIIVFLLTGKVFEW